LRGAWLLGVLQDDIQPFTMDTLAQYISRTGSPGLYPHISGPEGDFVASAAFGPLGPLSLVEEQLVHMHEVGQPRAIHVVMLGGKLSKQKLTSLGTVGFNRLN
jgi:hypothetical protein